MPAYHIALGGNLGDVAARFQTAAREMRNQGWNVSAQSSLYRTAPMGTAAGPAFLNAALRVEANCEPLELLEELQRIEAAAGRERSVRWGARPLDLDIILSGERVVRSTALTIPHPACWHRRFVLDPLVEIDPDAQHPLFNLSVTELLARLLPRPLPIAWLRGGKPAATPAEVARAFPGSVRLEEDVHEAAIVFTDQWLHDCPQQIVLPASAVDLQPAIDVLTAALDCPERINPGDSFVQSGQGGPRPSDPDAPVQHWRS